MNAIIDFFIAHTGGLCIGFFVWVFTLGVAIMFAERKGYDEGYYEGFDAGEREGVLEGRKAEQQTGTLIVR